MDWQPTCDAIVSFPDALKWVERMIKATPDNIIVEALDVEPAVLGADIGRRAIERLAKYGLPQEVQDFIFKRITLAGAMALLLMRQGNAQLWQDFIEPSDDDGKGIAHE